MYWRERKEKLEREKSFSKAATAERYKIPNANRKRKVAVERILSLWGRNRMGLNGFVHK